MDVFNYSSQEHLDELIKALEDQNEEPLLTNIQERYEEIVKHMNVTEELYDIRKGMQVSNSNTIIFVTKQNVFAYLYVLSLASYVVIF